MPSARALRLRMGGASEAYVDTDDDRADRVIAMLCGVTPTAVSANPCPVRVSQVSVRVAAGSHPCDLSLGPRSQAVGPRLESDGECKRGARSEA